MITAPLNLRSYLHQRDRRIDPVPFLDICVIALFFGLFSSRFLLAPGMSIDLPQGEPGLVRGTPAAAVLTILENNRLIFEGQIFEPESLGTRIGAFASRAGIEGETLLVKMDRRADFEVLVVVSEIARRSGFARVQVAAGYRQPERPPPLDAR